MEHDTKYLAELVRRYRDLQDCREDRIVTGEEIIAIMKTTPTSKPSGK